MSNKALFIAIVAASNADYITLESEHFTDEDSAREWLTSRRERCSAEMITGSHEAAARAKYDNVRGRWDRVSVDLDDLEDFSREYEVEVRRECTMLKTFTVEAESEEDAETNAIDEAESDDWSSYDVDIEDDNYECVETTAT